MHFDLMAEIECQKLNDKSWMTKIDPTNWIAKICVDKTLVPEGGVVYFDQQMVTLFERLNFLICQTKK